LVVVKNEILRIMESSKVGKTECGVGEWDSKSSVADALLLRLKQDIGWEPPLETNEGNRG
jgi:hypothetical protein